MKIKLFDAGNGDAILLESGETVLLFDGGTTASYKKWKCKLELHSSIDAIFITHIDNDHTNGIIKLLEENGCNLNPKVVKIKNIYFNGVEQILNDHITKSEEYSIEMSQISSLSDSEIDGQKIGYSEGTSLSYIIHKNNYSVNQNIARKRFCRESIKKFNISDFNVEVIGPSSSCLDKMKSFWLNELKRNKIKKVVLNKNHSIAFESYISKFADTHDDISSDISFTSHKTIGSLAKVKYVRDNSLNNESSICLLVSDQKKSILMLGDCHGEQIIDWMDDGKIPILNVDAVKLPHHGSARNFPHSLIERINCSKYFISTNGAKFNHPDESLIARIIYYSPNQEIDFYFNLQNDSFDFNFFNTNKHKNKLVRFHITEEVEL
ncbi:MBL fold metallo-hydrolase [Salmonella enterica]|nr:MULTISPECIES: MBL fold metallo-hydrolase [Enterobacteriaceae]EDY7119105.1 MBL fold metallo-hydrolase [Salmonella enterica]MGS93756.1 MBL fold metallo-hydrolase [Escherichia coli]EKV6726955.1 MBL fold metallo-hydrolase [Raoultella ornithinolytica]MCE9869625.1 MBL fold metallo-hydrolase [Raoultella ornithinolytica]MDW2596223.1 MBL fold metallo-hydrolase [Citrobacter braakii]